jgi:hypothetical protein
MSALASFEPTPESIPPANVDYSLVLPSSCPPNYHPLVSLHAPPPNPIIIESMQNPLQFILRAARIYPDKIALVHPDVEFPVAYTYAVWFVVRFPCSRAWSDA